MCSAQVDPVDPKLLNTSFDTLHNQLHNWKKYYPILEYNKLYKPIINRFTTYKIKLKHNRIMDYVQNLPIEVFRNFAPHP